MPAIEAAAANVAGGAGTKPPALSISFATDGVHSSNAIDDDEDSPALSALDSSAALILVHERDDEPTSPFEFTEDEDDRDDNYDIVSPIFQVRKSVVFPILSPSLVFLYLLSPFLKLGALDLPNTRLSLKFGLPALLLSALASVFARQIWYMLARYLQKADMTDILLDTFAKGRGKERQRSAIRIVVRVATGSMSILLALTYLRHALYTLHPVINQNQHPTLSYLVSTLIIGVAIAYLSYAKSFNNKRLVYGTSLSMLTYVAWLGCTIYAHVHGLLEAQTGWLGSGSFWQGLATTAFALCSSSTLPLYASLKSSSHPITTGKKPRTRSFRVLSILSVFTATLLLIPSVIFAAFPNYPAAYSVFPFEQVTPPTDISNSTTLFISVPPSISLNSTNILLSNIPSLSPPLPSEITLPVIEIQTVRRVLSAITLILGVPPLILATPPVGFASFRLVKFNVPRVLAIFTILSLSLISPRTFPSPDNTGGDQESYLWSSYPIFAFLTMIMLLATLLSTYFLPPTVHILIHIFKRPLSIVVPPRTPLVPTPSTSTDFETAQSSNRNLSDDLLLRKEHALQKKQFRKRIVWDLGVWLMFGASSVCVLYIADGFLGSS